MDCPRELLLMPCAATEWDELAALLCACDGRIDKEVTHVIFAVLWFRKGNANRAKLPSERSFVPLTGPILNNREFMGFIRLRWGMFTLRLPGARRPALVPRV